MAFVDDVLEAETRTGQIKIHGAEPISRACAWPGGSPPSASTC